MAGQGALLEAWPGMAVHARQGARLWASRGYDILLSEDGGRHWELAVRLARPAALRCCARLSATRRLLRCGVRAYVQLTADAFVAFADGRMYFGERGREQARMVAALRHGRAPLGQGCCRGKTGTCYFGEYWSNREREPVGIYCWRPEWAEPRLYYQFAAGSVRHLHGLQLDPFSGQLWATTGDRDAECRIGYFEESEGAPRFVTVAASTLDARAVSLMFAEEAVYWGTDAGRDTSATCNFICRWRRGGDQVERILPISGPAYYSWSGGESRLVFSTAVEGSASEADSLVRVWAGDSHRSWREVAAWKKDRYPSIFGYAVAKLPEGGLGSDRVYVVTEGLMPHDGTWVFDARRLFQ